MGWTGVVAGRWVQLRRVARGIQAMTVADPGDWNWLREFLQTEVDLAEVIESFPKADEHLQRAVGCCRGLRLLRQEPWECLASFILSSTKQIVQIRQIVRLLRERFGIPVRVPDGIAAEFAFPTAAQIAVLSEADLRACKMGFRAPYLLAAARRVESGGN
jgi:N-glycosylase/DNA lyase